MAILGASTGTLGSYNVGLAVAAGLIVPLSAQLDALLAVGLGPFQAELQAQFNAALATQATLTLQVGDPTAALRAAIAAVAQLQAALIASLTLPPVTLSIAAELGATAAIVGALTARLGVLSGAISLALRIKAGAITSAADLQAALNAGPVTAIAFGGDTWTVEGAKLANLFNGGTVDGHAITGLNPAETVLGGIVLATGSASAAAALSAIIQV